MDDSPRTPHRSRDSFYQSDYETAAEDSDGSLYYSTFDEKENDSDDKGNHQKTTRNSLASQRTLLEQCLQKNLNHTPRNEFNKRVSFNGNLSFISSTSMNSPTMSFRGAIGSQGTLVETECDARKRSKDEGMSNLQISSSATEDFTEMIGSSNRSMANDGNLSDIIEVGDDLSSTLIATTINATEALDEIEVEAIEEEAQVGAAGVASTTIVKTTNIPYEAKRFGPASSNFSTTSGLSNLPVPKKISVVDLAHPPPAPKHSHHPSSKRVSLFHGQSTKNYGFAKPNGKSGIPKASLMLAINNSMIHLPVLPSSSSSSQSKCKYCDKTFARQSILDVHLLEKCEKIPPFRHRQLALQKSNGKM